MKFIATVKILSMGITVLGISACGGGGGSSSNTPPTEPIITGGTASSPTAINLDLKNNFSTNSFNNYYQYTGVEDEKLIIHVTLDRQITRSENGNCQNERGMEKGTFIAVYDSNMNWQSEYNICGTDMTIKYPTDGTYIFNFKYGRNYSGENSGYFNAASVMP